MEQKQPCGNTDIVNFCRFCKCHPAFTLRPRGEGHKARNSERISISCCLKKVYCVDLKLELKTFENLEHRVCGTSHVHDCRGQDTFFTW